MNFGKNVKNIVDCSKFVSLHWKQLKSEIVIKNYSRDFFFFWGAGCKIWLFGKLICLTRLQCFGKVQHTFTIIDNLRLDAKMHSLIWFHRSGTTLCVFLHVNELFLAILKPIYNGLSCCSGLLTAYCKCTLKIIIQMTTLYAKNIRWYKPFAKCQRRCSWNNV